MSSSERNDETGGLSFKTNMATMVVAVSSVFSFASVTFSKPNERQAPGRLTDEISTFWSRETVPGANKVSSPSSTMLSEPSARQGDTPTGQELSKLCGSYKRVIVRQGAEGEGMECEMLGNDVDSRFARVKARHRIDGVG